MTIKEILLLTVILFVFLLIVYIATIDWINKWKEERRTKNLTDYIEFILDLQAISNNFNKKIINISDKAIDLIKTRKIKFYIPTANKSFFITDIKYKIDKTLTQEDLNHFFNFNFIMKSIMEKAKNDETEYVRLTSFIIKMIERQIAYYYKTPNLINCYAKDLTTITGNNGGTIGKKEDELTKREISFLITLLETHADETHLIDKLTNLL